MARDPRANELRAVAPLVVTGDTLTLVGTCTLATNGFQTVAFSSAELLRRAGEPLAIALTLDGKRTLPVASWTIGRTVGMGVIELGAAFPDDQKLDVLPLPIGAICATVDTRGAPSALVAIEANGGGFARRMIPVHVDAIDGGGMVDEITRLASPTDEADASLEIDGAPLFSWLPPDPVLGRGSEVVAVALGIAYHSKLFRPRALPALAELIGLDDLGRALPPSPGTPEPSNELAVVAGEIRDDAKK